MAGFGKLPTCSSSVSMAVLIRAGCSWLALEMAALLEVRPRSILLAILMAKLLLPKIRKIWFCGPISGPIITLPSLGVTNPAGAAWSSAG